jgi:hypothetical protein
VDGQILILAVRRRDAHSVYDFEIAVARPSNAGCAELEAPRHESSFWELGLNDAELDSFVRSFIPVTALGFRVREAIVEFF